MIGPRRKPSSAAAAAIALAGLLGSAPLAAPTASAQEACPDPAALTADLDGPLAHARYLADDALAGREAASPGARCAGEYVAGRFRALGLEPAGDPGRGYFQPFPIRVGSRLAGGNALRIAGESYPLEDAWVPYGFSGSGEVEAATVDGGYGFNRPAHGDAAYARTDVEGRVVVVEAGDPDDPHGRTTRSDPHFKATVAQGRGAAAVVVLLPGDAALPDPRGELRPLLEIPAVAVRGAAAEAARRAAAGGRSLRVVARVEERTAEARNVAALLPGARHDEIVVVGAHYDHLGLGGSGSLAPEATGAIHNGADDNASGVAVMLEVARSLAADGEPPERSVLFLAFSAEERGLVGSAHWVSDPTVPLDAVTAMLNLDMVGRLRDDHLTVMGVGTAEEWPRILRGANDALEAPLTLDTVADGFGRSDHASFYGRGVPVLHFFTNAHADYHRPGDDWEKLHVAGMERVGGLVGRIVRRTAATRPLTAVRGVGDPHGGRAVSGPDDEEAPTTGGYGAYLGTIPDFTPVDHGVRITGVREGSPADEAGLRGGDVIVGFGDREIGDLYALTYALRAHEAGDTVTVEVERDGERRGFTAVLGRR